MKQTLNRVILKGRLNKPICAIITSLVLVLGTFALVLPYQEAEASHDRLVTRIEMQRNMVTVVSPTPTEITDCETLNCGHIHHDSLTKRDYNRFLRWCGTDEVPVVVPKFASSDFVECDGKGPWRIVITTTYQTSMSAAPNDHGNFVGATVHAHAP